MHCQKIGELYILVNNFWRKKLYHINTTDDNHGYQGLLGIGFLPRFQVC